MVSPPGAPSLDHRLRRRSYARKRSSRTGFHEGIVTKPPVATCKPTPWLARRKLPTDSRRLLERIPHGHFVLPTVMDLESALTFQGHLDLFSGSRGAAKALAITGLGDGFCAMI